MEYPRDEEAEARELLQHRLWARARFEELKNCKRRNEPGSDLDVIGWAEAITAEAVNAERSRADIWLEKAAMSARRLGELATNTAVVATCRGALFIFGGAMIPKAPHKQQTTTQIYNYPSVGDKKVSDFRF